MHQNLEAFPYEEEDWSSDRFYDFLVHVMENQANLQEAPKRRAAFLMLDRYVKKNSTHESSVINDGNIWKDLNLFCGQKNTNYYLAEKIDRTHTIFGKIMLYNMLAQPSIDIAVLQQRQALIHELVVNNELFDALEKRLKKFKASENMLLSFWTNDPFKQAAQRKYFNYASQNITDALNKSATMLTLRAWFEHQQRCITTLSTIIAGVLLPLYGISEIVNQTLPNKMQELSQNLRSSGGPIFGILFTFMKNKRALGALATASGIVSAMNIKELAEWASDNFTLEAFMHDKMGHVANAIGALKDIDTIVEQHKILHKKVTTIGFKKLFSDHKSQDLATLLSVLTSNAFQKKSSFFTNKGALLVAFKLFCSLKDQFEDALIELGELDAFIGLARLYKEHEHYSMQYSFVDLKDTASPYINLKEFWNPLVDLNKVVSNSIELGDPNNRQNMVITGPNAGGKSTLLKAAAIAVIMAQSFGMAPAHAATITPFDKIMTYLNVVDDIGSGNSLFKAQVLRTQTIIDTVNSLAKDQKSFILIDEMFNGTSPAEAQACACAVAKNLGDHANTISIIATHHDLLTTLEEESDAYHNYHMSVIKSPTGALEYPFVLLPGISHQHVALDILRNEGFDSALIKDAQKILDSKQD